MKLVAYLLLFNIIVNSLPDKTPPTTDAEDPNNQVDGYDPNNNGEQDNYDPNNNGEPDNYDPNIPESGPIDENIPESDPPDENIPESDPIDENIAESDPEDENIANSPPKKDPIKVIRCDDEPCEISPENDDNKATYVVMTNDFEDCRVSCKGKNCGKKYRPLVIISGCNRTTVNCDDDCGEIDIRIGDEAEIPDDLSDELTRDDLYDIKDSAIVSCTDYACKLANIKYSGVFRYGVLVKTSGRKAIENGEIDCEYTTSQCFIDCEIDDETDENSCLKTTLKSNTRDGKISGCRGDCDDEAVTVLRPVKPAPANCDSGEVVLRPSAEDTIICTKGCRSCKVDCSGGNCRDITVYSGADVTDIDCSGVEKACERIKVNVGALELEENLPAGYLPEEFEGTKSSFNMDCDDKVACGGADICITGKFIKTPKISAAKIDAFQNGKLKCRGNDCELDCAFDGCDGSIFDCKNNDDSDSLFCLCNDLEEEKDAPPVTNDETEDQPDVPTPDTDTPKDQDTPTDPKPKDADTATGPKAPYKTKEEYYYYKSTTTKSPKDFYYYDPDDQPDGPTCPIINSGKPSEPQWRQSSIANNGNNNGNGGKPNKTAGITSMIVLAAIVGLLYWVIYKTKVCKRGSKYETDLMKESTYNTFGSATVEMEVA